MKGKINWCVIVWIFLRRMRGKNPLIIIHFYKSCDGALACVSNVCMVEPKGAQAAALQLCKAAVGHPRPADQ
jgi:hypothetical protein